MFNGPSSAVSVEIRIGGEGGVILRGNRRSEPAAYQQSLVASTPLPVGTKDYTALFYAEPNQGGAVVAQGSGTLVLEANGSLSGAVTLTKTIQQVQIPLGQAIPVTTVQALTFQALDAQGATVAISPGSAFWTLADTPSTSIVEITADQTIRALAPGSAQLKVTVDGVVSAATAVTVPNPLQLTPQTPSVTLDKTVAFQASISGTADTRVTWAIVEGSRGGTISDTGLYRAPKVAGTYHVTATSVAFPTASQTATVTVTSGSGAITLQ